MITTDPMTTVRQYIDGFNRGDATAYGGGVRRTGVDP